MPKDASRLPNTTSLASVANKRRRAERSYFELRDGDDDDEAAGSAGEAPEPEREGHVDDEDDEDAAEDESAGSAQANEDADADELAEMRMGHAGANIENCGNEFDDLSRCSISEIRRRLEAAKALAHRTTFENGRLRGAIATLRRICCRHRIPIPDSVVVAANATVHSAANSAVPVLAGIAPFSAGWGAEFDGKSEWCMRQMLLPDTSRVFGATRFKPASDTWPHAIARYARGEEVLSPIVEGRHSQVLAFKLHHRDDFSLAATERALRSDSGRAPLVKFRLMLVYDDTGEKVTIDSLDPFRAKTVSTLAYPDVVNHDECVKAMAGGIVTFKISRLHILSGMTRPRHRKFRFRLVCADADLHDLHLHADTPSFYCLARLQHVPTMQDM